MDTDNYCPHVTCIGINDCPDYLPANGSGMCILSMSHKDKINFFREEQFKAYFNNRMSDGEKCRKIIHNLRLIEHGKDGCDGVSDVFDLKGWMDG